MMARTGTGWQYVLADLSLILFMVTAAALSQTMDTAPQVATISPQGEPVAYYRVGAGAPPLGQWLQDQSADPRQQLTILAQYTPGNQLQALTQAQALAREAGEAGTSARIVIEPGQGGTIASLAYDVPKASMAQDLQGPKQNNPVSKE
jgi:hypothetical protein